MSERVHALQRRAYAIEAALISCWDMPGLVESVEDLGASPEEFHGAFASCHPDEVVPERCVGIVALERGIGEVCISRLAVEPSFSRMGVGRALVRHVLGVCVGRVVVSTGALNVPARRLYESLGFVHEREGFTPDGQTPLVVYGRGR